MLKINCASNIQWYCIHTPVFHSHNMIAFSGPILGLCWGRFLHLIYRPEFWEKIFHQEWLKMTFVQGVQANKMPFFQKICPKKSHPCPQCLEWPLVLVVLLSIYSNISYQTCEISSIKRSGRCIVKETLSNVNTLRRTNVLGENISK